MLPEQILSSDLLDILFADRNKSYGAYPLRKGYNKRLTKSLFMTGAIILLALTVYYTNGEQPVKSIAMGPHVVVDLTPVSPDEPKPPQPPPPPPPPPARPVSTVRHVVPVIVADEQADAPPPTLEELNRSVIALVNQEGVDAPDITAPPVEDRAGIVETPTRTEEEKIFTKVEIESSYPGGMAAWRRFLIKTVNYPGEAIEKEIEGAVVVKFIVDKDGKVSDVIAISGPEELRGEAVRVISKSGKWTPAIQNGNNVKSYKLQQIIFRLQNE